ncbi:MAG TPA: hypothetical protein ACFYD3_06125 [Candidatus Hypogeohydataceae bacterium YC41]
MDVAHPAGHFSLGMGAAFLTACALLPFKTFREILMPYSPPFIIFCGCWALIPDLPLALCSIPSLGKWMPWDKESTHHWLHGPIIGNIFFMHAYIDKILDRTMIQESFEILGLIAIVFMFSVIIGCWTVLSVRKRYSKEINNP